MQDVDGYVTLQNVLQLIFHIMGHWGHKCPCLTHMLYVDDGFVMN